MTIGESTLPDDRDILNIYHHGGNASIGATGLIWFPVIINNAGGVRNVYLQLWGKKLSSDGTNPNVLAWPIAHNHQMGSVSNIATTRDQTYTGDGLFVDTTAGANTRICVTALNVPAAGVKNAVPQAVEIWIDGTQYTASIGDPNSKGATMYDSGNDDWGVDGTTEWDTGVLDISSEISWTAGLHYIELKETGDTGGTLVYHLSINAGFNV